MEKNIIRNKIQYQRRQLDSEESLFKSEVISMKILINEYYFLAEQVFLYVSAKGEVDTNFLIEQSLKDHKKVALPKVFLDGSMKFFQISSMRGLILSPFGILEPSGLEQEVFPTKNTLIIVPLIAFDQKLNRIGYGKGYYDSYLPGKDYMATIGIAYELQRVDDFIANQWDIRLNQVVTEYNTF